MRSRFGLVAFTLVLAIAALSRERIDAQEPQASQEAAQQPPASSEDPHGGRAADSKSGSPYLTVPEYLQNLTPATPPPPRAVRLPATPGDTVTYIKGSRSVSVVPASAWPTSPEGAPGDPPKSSPGFQGLIPTPDADENALALSRNVLGTDDRTHVTAVTTYPWRTIVYIALDWGAGFTSWCTGALIDSYHVLTAGHCVHNGTNWVSDVEIIPGRNQSYMPYYKSSWTLIRSYTEWTVNQDWNHDWALITVDRNIGSFTGWMGRQTATCNFFFCDGIYTGTLNNAGYGQPAPDGPSNNGRMFFDSDSGQSANDTKHWYYMDTEGGNSGGPVWRFDGTNRYILTVHAYGGSSTNSGTRLNSDKYDRLNAWTGADTPPVDLADYVDDGLAFFYASHVTPLVRGETWMSVGSDVRNIGTANPGGFWVRYVLSTNTLITTADYMICEAFVAGVSAFAWANSDCSGIVPAHVPAGFYYVGVIYDVYNARGEFNEGNNTAFRSSLVQVRAKYNLGVFKAGAGSGIVTSGPAGISCGLDCSEPYLDGTLVSLSHAAAAGSAFAGWSGACSGLGSCVVTMDAAKSVTATFKPQRLLSVKVKGSGSVSSVPAGISCGADCTENYAEGASVTLNASAAPGWTFVSFTGHCQSKTPSCTLAMLADASVTATFKPAADLVLAMSDSPDPVSVGNALTYTIAVTNAGPSNTSAVKVLDTLNANLKYVSATPSQGQVSSTVTSTGARKLVWSVGALANGGSATLIIKVKPQVAGTVKNTANVSTGVTVDPAPANNKQTASTVINP